MSPYNDAYIKKSVAYKNSMYFKREGINAIFSKKDKHQSFLQAGSIILTGHIQSCPKYPK